MNGEAFIPKVIATGVKRQSLRLGKEYRNKMRGMREV